MFDQAVDPNLTVLIVGAGLGGLMLGAILESAGISYHILERTTEFRPLGSAMVVSGNILPVFEQLGIYDDLKRESLRHVSTDMYNMELKKLGGLSSKGHKIASKLYDVILRKVPAYKISMGKKVLRTKEHDNKVTVYCSDNTEYEGRILVGADGAYSAVRQDMYKKLEGEDRLPACDKEDFSIGYIATVGVASFPNAEKYPELSDDRAHFRTVIGNNYDSVGLATSPNNQICWGLQVQVDESTAREQRFRSSGWGPEAVEAMLQEFENFPCALGGTMKDIFDATPRDLISKVFLEEKVFQTWYNGRSVLLGDACHKMLPGGGQGAVVAMKDAVVLANCIYNMSDMSDHSISIAFASYYRQRHSEAEEMLSQSAQFSKIMHGHKWTERLLRVFTLKYAPDWLMQIVNNNSVANRPQINWLPLVEMHGSGQVLPQEGRSEAEKKPRAVSPWSI
ncbi:hypothetical protein BGX20_000924 [Mortierella sp. AD010]|nr:hypothetical protein BGX20_000924 [Mortierella sp. AD010]